MKSLDKAVVGAQDTLPLMSFIHLPTYLSNQSTNAACQRQV